MVPLSKAFSFSLASAKQTVYETSRFITHHSWKGKAPYKAESTAQQACIDKAFHAAKDLNLDAHGAVEGEIAGAFHNHNPGCGGVQWITVRYKNAQGKTLYHKKADGTIWDRVHVYQDLSINYQPTEKPVTI
ncbi:hypothetical protein EW146_g6080 [Bondarzewia mesenterica]|uniref:Uncharacterized protein n=1 Tax=Bondarzewia mesenterica TaxID=1095465 RepID=A0A4S4LQM5_9AGAM|nr:hypothetical protein EW146_g6080 [Bondarzewia mesenterica]